MVALSLVAVIFSRPILGLVLFAFMACFLPFTRIIATLPITISEALLIVTWAGVLLHILSARLDWRLGKTERAVLVLLVYSVVPFVVGMLLVPESELSLVRWMRWLLNMSSIFLVLMLVRDDSDLWAVVVATLVGAAFMLLLSLGSFLRHFDARDMLTVLDSLRYPLEYRTMMAETFEDVSRISSPWLHPNILGGFLTLMLPLAGVMLLFIREPLRMLLILLLGMAIVVLLFSISRAAMIGLGFTLIWFVHRRVPYAGLVMVFGAVAVVVVILSYPPIQERFASMFMVKHSRTVVSSTAIRLDEYRAFDRAVVRYPLGVGFGTDPTTIAENDPELRQISNLWLNYVYKMGIFALPIFIWVTLCWWREVRERVKEGPFDAYRLTHMGLVGGLLGTFVIGLFDHYFSFQWVLIAVFWLFMGLSLYTARRRVPDVDVTTHSLPASQHGPVYGLNRLPTNLVK